MKHILISLILAIFSLTRLACVETTPQGGAENPAKANAEVAPSPTPPQALQSGHDPFSTPAAETHEQTGHVADATQAERYECPMHPEVHDTKPGRCPKCGMALEKVEPKVPR